MIGSTLKIAKTNTMASTAEDNRKNNMSSELDILEIRSSPVVVIFLSFSLEFVIFTVRWPPPSMDVIAVLIVVVQSEI